MPGLFSRNNRLWVRAKQPLSLTPIRPSAGLRETYRAKLDAIVEELHQSIVYWLQAEWRKQPTLAEDASPVTDLRALFHKLGKRWDKKFDELAPKLAEYLADKAHARVSNNFRAQLKDAGLTVEFVMSRPVRDAYQAVIAENVGLIKSIAAQHLGSVEQEVMRSVAQGRDLATLAKTLQTQYGVTRRRAAFIARDQNNKATSVITRARQLEVGVTHARWRHSAGGNHPRPTHVKASKDGVVYEVEKGWYDPALKKYIWPGTEPYCRCVSQPIIPGF